MSSEEKQENSQKRWAPTFRLHFLLSYILDLELTECRSANKFEPQQESVSTGKEKKDSWLNLQNFFDLLSISPHPSTAHHMIETMEALLEIAPREIILRIARIVESGKDGGLSI